MPRQPIADEPLVDRTIGFTKKQRRWLALEAKQLERSVPWLVRKAVDGFIRRNGGMKKHGGGNGG